MKYSKEELDKLIENAPRNEKGQPVISNEDFTDNVSILPMGTRAEDGRYAKDGGYIKPMEKGTARTRAIASSGGKASNEINAERRRISETIDIFLKKADKDGVTMQDKFVEAILLKAMEGCVGAAEFIRDTVGEKPTDNVAVNAMTDGDKALLQKVLKRMGYDESGDSKE